MVKNKLAQKIIVNLYLRHRTNRKLVKIYNKLNIEKLDDFVCGFNEGIINDSWNALQVSKQIYYNNELR